MRDILLTIGIPSIPSRMRMNLEPMFSKIMAQIGTRKDIEVISILDNRSITIGKKRHMLHRLAQGKYCAIIDDDDDIAPNYVDEVYAAIKEHNGVDVIHYNQEAIFDGVSFLVVTDITAPRDPFEQMPRTPRDQNGNWIPVRRPPWHWCAWRTEFAKQFPFGDSNSGEDTMFVSSAVPNIKSHYKIDKILHTYKFSSVGTSAPLLHGNVNKPVVMT